MANGNQQNPQSPQSPQYPQYPKGPQYYQGAPMPPGFKPKKSVWPKVLLIGCIGLAAIAIAVIVFFGLIMCNGNEHVDQTGILLEELNLTDKEPAVLEGVNVDSILHVGMPRDSVLMALGKPAEYNCANWSDDMYYVINDSTGLLIFFSREGKVDSFEHYDVIDAEPYVETDSTKLQ